MNQPEGEKSGKGGVTKTYYLLSLMIFRFARMAVVLQVLKFPNLGHCEIVTRKDIEALQKG